MANLFDQLMAILPARPLQVGQVTHFADGVATVQLPGGGVIRARGEAQQGQKVFVRDGVIEGAAPDLPLIEFDI